MQLNVSTVFQHLGLKKEETKVYLACLKKKDGLRVQEIAKETGIKRSTVNLIIERLLQKGFITYYLDGARRVFTAEPPELLAYNFENVLGELKNFIPILKTVSGVEIPTKVRFFDGKEDIEKIYADVLLTLRMQSRENNELLAVSSGKDVFKVMPNHQKQFIDKRVKEGIPIRWIAPESEISRSLGNSKEEQRKIKFFDNQKYQFHIELDIYANSVAFFSLDDSPGGVIIESKELSSSLRSFFNLVWDLLPNN